MSPTVSRLLLSLAVVVALPFFYVEGLVLLNERTTLRFVPALLITTLATGTILILSWFAIWRQTVRWTKRRIVVTLWTSAATVLVALAFGALNEMLLGGRDEALSIILAGILWAALWIGAMARVWCPSGSERADQTAVHGGRELRCPKCDYDMHGLHEARCPECGTQYTIDGLVDAAIEQRNPLDSD
jgi:hypothetical protein